MKMKVLFAICLITAGVMLFQACEVNGCSRGSMSSNGKGGGSNYSGGTQKSGRGDGGGDNSDKMVGNCMTCHGPNGGGSGCFTIGGTIYDSTQTVRNPAGTIMFYTQPNGGGQLVATLDADETGNFYTTSVIKFGSGLYPAVVSRTSGKVQYMPQPTVIGACGSCHGISNAVIWIN